MQYVDASTFQAVLDVAAYKAAGYSRIAHRATFRDTGTDDRFVGRWPTLTGLVRQSYHFAYSTDNQSAAMQHHVNVVESVGGWNPGDEVMLDLEWFQVNNQWIGCDPSLGKAYAHAFLDPIGQQFPNVRRFIYANAWYIEAAGITQADFPNVGLITASYGNTYRTPAGFDHSCIWQSTDTATVPGFPGEQVDLNQIVCPSNLEHLTIGGDMPLSQADLNAIGQMISQGAILVGAKVDQATAQTASKIDNVTATIMGNDPGQADKDPTHYSEGDVGRGINALSAKLDALAAKVAALPGGGSLPPDEVAVLQQAVTALTQRIDGLTLKAVSS